MLLLGYKIGDSIAGVNINKFYANQIGNNPPFLISESVIDNYEDISSIINWDIFGNQCGKDYKFIRNEIISFTK